MCELPVLIELNHYHFIFSHCSRLNRNQLEQIEDGLFENQKNLERL